MKFIRLLIAVHILMTGSALWADGLRFTADKKGLEEEHVTLKLTPEQVTQVEQFREVILMPKYCKS